MRNEFLEPPEAYCARMGSCLFSENALFFIFIIYFTFQDEIKSAYQHCRILFTHWHWLCFGGGVDNDFVLQKFPRSATKNIHNFMIIAGELAKGEAVEIKITVWSKRIISIEYIDYITSLLRALTWRLEYYRSNYLHVEFISKNNSKKQVNQGNFCTKQWLTHAGWQKIPKDREQVY